MAKRRKAFTGYPSEKARRRKDAGPSSRVVREPLSIESPAPASTLGSARHEAPRLRRGPGGKFLIPAATVGVMGGAGYAVHRHRKGSTVTKADAYLEAISKNAVSGPRGKNFPDRVMGASTPSIGQTRLTGMLKPTGRHVSHANKLQRFTPLPGYRKQPSGKNAQRLLHVKGGGKDRAAGEFKGKLVVATKADSVEKASTKPFQTFGAGRANAKAGFKVKRGGTLRYRAGEASTDRRVQAGVGATAAGGTGVAVHRSRKKRSEVGKSSDFVARIGLIDVDRVETYGRQVGRRGARIA
jgi:hypothetical protein